MVQFVASKFTNCWKNAKKKVDRLEVRSVVSQKNTLIAVLFIKRLLKKAVECGFYSNKFGSSKRKGSVRWRKCYDTIKRITFPHKLPSIFVSHGKSEFWAVFIIATVLVLTNLYLIASSLHRARKRSLPTLTRVLQNDPLNLKSNKVIYIYKQGSTQRTNTRYSLCGKRL